MLLLLLATGLANEPTWSWETLAQVQTLEASFTQTQHRAWLQEPLVSTGTITFSRPATIEWRVIHPSPSTMRWHDGQLSLQTDGQTALTVDTATTPQAAPWVDVFTVWLSGDVAAIERSFTAEYSADGVVLTPRSEPMQQQLSAMTLTVAKSGQWVQRVVLTEPDADSVIIELSDVTVQSTPQP